MPQIVTKRRTWRRLALLIGLVPLLGAALALAQDTGQICLQAFVDENENGIREESEAPLARGVAASLLDARGVTLASLLLSDTADGLACFDGLFAGEYQVVISSSEYQATNSATVRASVRPGAAPARIDFGAKRLAGVYVPDPLAIVDALDPAAAQTLIVAVAAAAGAIVLMALLGVFTYFLMLRQRARRRRALRAEAAEIVPSAGLPLQPDATDDYLRPRQRLDPNRGSPLLFADDDPDLAGSG